jgi:homoserine dehydrogenase
MRQVNVAILGGGTVGGGVVEGVHRNGALMASRLGVALQVRHLVVRDPRKKRDFEVAPGLVSSDWRRAVEDPATEIVVELVGGTTTAREMVLASLKAGKPVVTANKALLSAHGEELFQAASESGTNLYYEADHQGPARSPGRQPHHPPVRNPQRHLQLHPHPHAVRGRGVRGGAG